MAALGGLMNVLLPHARRNELPPDFLDAPEIGQVSVITEPGYVQRYGRDVDVHQVDSIADVEQVRRTAMRILRERDIHRVLAPFELSVPVSGYLRSYFGLPGLTFETANVFANKYLMKRRAVDGGLPVTAFRVAYTLADVVSKADDVGWPVVIKPVVGEGTLDVVVFDDAESLARFGASPAAESIRQLDIPLIVEKYVDVQAEYNCNGIVHDGEVVFAAAMKHLVPRLGCPIGLNASFTLPPDHPDRAGILDLHAGTVHAFGLQAGVTHMEVLKSRDGLLAGGIACRPPGGGIPGALQLQYDIDVWRAFRETSLGLEPDLRVTEREGLLVTYLLPERDREGASAAAGVVYLSVRDEAEVSHRMVELAERYVLDVEEEDDS